MDYEEKIVLKNGEQCCLKSLRFCDGKRMLNLFIGTHNETDFLLSYPDEITFDENSESSFLQALFESRREAEIGAFIGEKLVGSAGITAKGKAEKLSHRADFGVAVSKEYCGLGIGKALTIACIKCAKKACYKQIELEVSADNKAAIALYKSLGFVEYGRNAKGFKLRGGKYSALVYMFLEL